MLADVKPPWLKIDFDKWKVEDSEDENEAVKDVVNVRLNTFILFIFKVQTNLAITYIFL